MMTKNKNKQNWKPEIIESEQKSWSYYLKFKVAYKTSSSGLFPINHNRGKQSQKKYKPFFYKQKCSKCVDKKI